MNNARPILIQILAVIGSGQRTEREVDEFCSWIEVQVMTELFEALPKEKQEQAIDRFMSLPPDKKKRLLPLLYRQVHAGEGAEGDQNGHSGENC